MSEPVVLPLTAAQVALFQQYEREEAAARKTLETVSVSRSGAALAVVLATHAPEAVQGQNLNVDVVAGVITFTPNAVHLEITAP